MMMMMMMMMMVVVVVVVVVGMMMMLMLMLMINISNTRDVILLLLQVTTAPRSRLSVTQTRTPQPLHVDKCTQITHKQFVFIWIYIISLFQSLFQDNSLPLPDQTFSLSWYKVRYVASCTISRWKILWNGHNDSCYLLNTKVLQSFIAIFHHFPTNTNN